MNEKGPIFTSPEEQEKECARSKEKCLEAGAIDVQFYNAIESDSCPSVWDGIACWNSTPAGVLQVQQCPTYIAGFDQQAEASRQCMDNGQWFMNSDNQAWTNYSMCYSEPLATVLVKFPDMANASHFLPWMTMTKRVQQVGYTFSLLSLIVAFLILACTKRLRCPRNTLHMHLFVSFILRAFMMLLKDLMFVQGVGLPSDVIFKDGFLYFSQQKHNWVCKCVMSIWQYCHLANYSWILMEGLYLHNLIFMAMFSDSSAITMYVFLGWGLPIVVVVTWIIVRATRDDTYCWTTYNNQDFTWIINVPIIVSNLINFVLFLNIVRVLFLKLQSSICEETRRYRYRKWGRSTLVLVPLFGVHYLLFLLVIWKNPKVEIWGIFLLQLFSSFQGFVVAVLYCFMNGEVRTEMEKKWRWRANAPPLSGDRKRSSVLEVGSRCGMTSGMSGTGNGVHARRQRWSPSSCTSNCTTLESAVPHRFEPMFASHDAQPGAQSTLLLQRASDHVLHCSSLADMDRGENSENKSGVSVSERLLHTTSSSIDQEAVL